jgi:hypothetical protein
MKRCPKCSRSYPDDNQKFCTLDGGLLVPAEEGFDPNATILATRNLETPPAEAPTRPVGGGMPDLNRTVASSPSAPTETFNRQTGPTDAETVFFDSSSPPPPRQPSAPLPAAPAEPGESKKKSNVPMIVGILLLVLVLGVGAVVALFFLVIKPRLDQTRTDEPVVVRSNENENVDTNENVNMNSVETKTETEFVAPPNTTKFTSSQANLDGKLAEHYFDFSFYYPDNWVVDPKAGTAGSGNFAKVERRLPPDFTQENLAVRWYDSKGTYASDLPNYPALVEEFSASLAQAFFGYRKVSEGPTRINSLDAYEFRWVGDSKGTVKGDLQLWGRVVFVPSGVEGDKTGAILTMFTTSLAPELSGVEDVGEKGQSPVILESFRFSRN